MRNFEGKPEKNLRSISMLWPNVEHFVLMNNSENRHIRRYSCNKFFCWPQPSGTEQSTIIILKGVNLTKKDITPEYLGCGDTVSAMRDGRLDGGALPAGVPASAVTDMYASGVRAKLLEVTDKQPDDINHVANS